MPDADGSGKSAAPIGRRSHPRERKRRRANDDHASTSRPGNDRVVPDTPVEVLYSSSGERETLYALAEPLAVDADFADEALERPRRGFDCSARSPAAESG